MFFKAIAWLLPLLLLVDNSEGSCSGTAPDCSSFDFVSSCTSGNSACKLGSDGKSCVSACEIVADQAKCQAWGCEWTDGGSSGGGGGDSGGDDSGPIQLPPGCNELADPQNCGYMGCSCSSRTTDTECWKDGMCVWCPPEGGFCTDHPPGDGFCGEPDDPWALCGQYFCGFCGGITTEAECDDQGCKWYSHDGFCAAQNGLADDSSYTCALKTNQNDCESDGACTWESYYGSTSIDTTAGNKGSSSTDYKAGGAVAVVAVAVAGLLIIG